MPSRDAGRRALSSRPPRTGRSQGRSHVGARATGGKTSTASSSALSIPDPVRVGAPVERRVHEVREHRVVARKEVLELGHHVAQLPPRLRRLRVVILRRDSERERLLARESRLALPLTAQPPNDL
eukprot:5794701-Prymnesium_polylepis.1